MIYQTSIGVFIVRDFNKHLCNFGLRRLQNVNVKVKSSFWNRNVFYGVFPLSRFCKSVTVFIRMDYPECFIICLDL